MTTKDPIEITLPKSVVNDISTFAQKMILVESQVINQNEKAVANLFKALACEADLTPNVCAKIAQLSRNLVELEKRIGMVSGLEYLQIIFPRQISESLML